MSKALTLRMKIIIQGLDFAAVRTQKSKKRKNVVDPKDSLGSKATTLVRKTAKVI